MGQKAIYMLWGNFTPFWMYIYQKYVPEFNIKILRAISTRGVFWLVNKSIMIGYFFDRFEIFFWNFQVWKLLRQFDKILNQLSDWRRFCAIFCKILRLWATFLGIIGFILKYDNCLIGIVNSYFCNFRISRSIYKLLSIILKKGQIFPSLSFKISPIIPKKFVTHGSNIMQNFPKNGV